MTILISLYYNNFYLLLLLFSICFLLPTIFSSSTYNYKWKGNKCYHLSNSLEMEKNILSSNNNNKNCFFKLSSIKFDKMNSCLYWISGRFHWNEHNTTTTTTNNNNNNNNKTHHYLLNHKMKILERNHWCIINKLNRSNNEQIELNRNLSKNIIKINPYFIKINNYSCDDELPIGFQKLTNHNEFPSAWYSPIEIYNLLKGKSLLFEGNSFSRQLFQRLITLIRNINFFVEHYAHQNMIYGFDMNTDYWEICPESEKNCNGSNDFWSNFSNKDDVAVVKLKWNMLFHK